MCLACELDEIWYAEWERLAAPAGSAGVSAAVSEDPAGAEIGKSTNADEAPLPGSTASRTRFLCEETE